MLLLPDRRDTREGKASCEPSARAADRTRKEPRRALVQRDADAASCCDATLSRWVWQVATGIGLDGRAPIPSTRTAKEASMNRSDAARPPLPPFTCDTAIQKVRVAEDAWNSRDPARVSLA
jgi:hypothetical protein